jgi:hypothetical protein
MPRSRNLPESQDDDHAAEGLVHGMVICLTFWFVVLALAWMVL